MECAISVRTVVSINGSRPARAAFYHARSTVRSPSRDRVLSLLPRIGALISQLADTQDTATAALGALAIAGSQTRSES